MHLTTTQTMRIPRWRQFTTSLRFRVMLLIFLLSVSTFLLVSVSFANRRQQSLVSAEAEALRYARLVGAHYSQQIEAARQVLIALSEMPDIQQANAPACSNYLASLIPFYPNFTHVSSYDLAGNMPCYSEPGPPGLNYADSPLYPPLLETRDFVIGMYNIGPVTQQQIIGMVYPIFDEAGEVAGAVGVALDLSWVGNWLEQIEMPEDTVLFVTDGQGDLISTNRADLMMLGQPVNSRSIECFEREDIHCPDGTVQSDLVDGVTRLYGYTTLEEFPGAAYVSVGLSRAVVLGPLNRAQRIFYIGIVIFSGISLLIVSVSAEWLIVRPVQSLVQVTNRLMHGDFSARRDLPHHIGELEQLSTTIGQLARSLEQRDREITQRTRELQERIEQHQRTQIKLRETITLLSHETQARHAAQQADELKRRFLAMVSHELRTPLTSIKGYASSLLAEDVTWNGAQKHEFTQIINEESDHLLDMVEQLLDLSQIDAGTLRIHPELTTACAFLTRIEPRLKALVPQHRLVVHCDDEQHLAIQMDTRRVAQVLSNLINNAGQHAPPQTNIEIRVSVSPGETASEPAARFCVRDYGPGIPPYLHPHLFAPFNHVEYDGARKGGVGLGLAICKGIIEAHGGQIGIMPPEDNTGTCIQFTLPRMPALRNIGEVDLETSE